MSVETPENKSVDDGLNKFYSKIRSICIPLPQFSFFHRPSEVQDVDSHFVGRERILRLLKNWLDIDNGNYTGSYLITGYRGMGKTSFVGKAIDEAMARSNAGTLRGGKASPRSRERESARWKIYFHLLLLGALTFMPVVLVGVWLLAFRDAWLPGGWMYRPHCIGETFWFLLLLALYSVVFGRYVWRLRKKRRHRSILTIKVNIGNEVSDTKDLLSLLAYSTKNKLSEYIRREVPLSPGILCVRYFVWSVVAVLVYMLHHHLLDVLEAGSSGFFGFYNNSVLYKTIEYVNASLLYFRTAYPFCAALVGIGLLCLIALPLAKLVTRGAMIASKYLGSPRLRPTEIVEELDALCNRIDASIKEDDDPYGVNVSGIRLDFRRKFTKHYQPATVREIEQKLVSVFERIHDSQVLNCRLIVILDELDKLNGPIRSEGASEPEFPEFTSNENGLGNEASQHQKRHRILSLLGQLKYFISTAKAKFIFIAGHELYDAYLADVSDREYSISSIFNGVINVDSFFSSDSRTRDISKLTETYVCKHLMWMGEESDIERERGGRPDSEVYNLKRYWEFLTQGRAGENRAELRSQEHWELETVFVFLRQFITYLAFMSNGAPKKLTTHFERYVVEKSADTSDAGHRIPGHISVRLPKRVHAGAQGALRRRKPPKPAETYGLPGSPEFLLRFGYHDQQKIGFIHYMAHPIFENIISPSSEYGDKLLIASSFLIAHIYKHHTSGFSGRNLEYLPELIDSNRTPELREYINSIIGCLAQIHLTSITSGVYTYKFPMRLTEEISVFTKKSEELSAIFNFSPDYSLAVKKYYYRLLDFYCTKQGDSMGVKAALHHNVGDIHMANAEYTEAILQFRLGADALESRIRTLRANPDENLASIIVRYTRIMLKLGLAYEKRNTLDSAYLVYSNLMTWLVSFREFREEKFGLQCRIAREDRSFDETFWSGRRILLLQGGSRLSADTFDRSCYPASYPVARDRMENYWIYGDELTDNLCDFLTPEKERLITKLSVYEDLRVAYQPILAKLFTLEKHNICGITKDNVKVAEAEFQYLFLITNSKDKYLLRVDFYRKLGDILYYKNRYFYETEPCSVLALFACWGVDIKSAAFDYCYSEKLCKSESEELLRCLERPIAACGSWKELIQLLCDGRDERQQVHIKRVMRRIVPRNLRRRIADMVACGRKRMEVRAKGEHHLKSIPCYACRYYSRSLSLLRSKLLCKPHAEAEAPGSCSRVFDFLDAVMSSGRVQLLSMRYNELLQIALTLDSMGNTLLSCAGGEPEPKSGSGPKSGAGPALRAEFLDALFAPVSSAPEGAGPGFLAGYRSRLGHLEKVVLYYWTAMKYYERSSCRREAAQCLVKILNLTASYMTKQRDLKRRDIRFDLDDDSLRRVVAGAVESIYATLDYYNLKETKRFNEIFGEKIVLSQTSVMPDIEELLLSYYENRLRILEFRSECEDLSPEERKRAREDYLELLAGFYGTPSLSYLRNDSLTYNRIISLMFKAKLNERIWGLLLEAPLEEFSGELCERFVSEESWPSFDPIGRSLKVSADRHALFEFLIADSIFCLANITNFIMPMARTTLFTNSFCHSVYYRLYYWVACREIYETCLRGKRGKEGAERCDAFDRRIEELIEVHDRTVLRLTFLREMANAYCTAAEEMHTEGNEYQNFIRGFYLLDDDLQNNTCQFYFALERYRLNASGMRIIPMPPKKDSAAGPNDCAHVSDYFCPLQYYRRREPSNSPGAPGASDSSDSSGPSDVPPDIPPDPA